MESQFGFCRIGTIPATGVTAEVRNGQIMANSGKTEKATPKKREDERKKGNIFQSKDVIHALGLIAITFIFKLIISPILLFIKSILKDGISKASLLSDLTVTVTMNLIVEFVINILIIIAPIGIIIGLISFILGGIQTQFLFNVKKLKPKFSRLNPISGMQKIFTLRSLVELLKSLIKVVIIASVLYSQINFRLSEVVQLPALQLSDAMSWIGNTIYDITIKIAMYMAIFAVADYFYQWWEHEKELKMTKQEIKDEYKQTEGDPQVKSRIKDVQRKMATMRMMKKVPQADVVIKNPTHYAIALKYNPPKDKAPIVIAKGKDYLALKIIEIAEKNGVQVTENVPLARGLYAAVEVDRQIPEEFYKPVADILAFIYKLKKSKKKG